VQKPSLKAILRVSATSAREISFSSAPLRSLREKKVLCFLAKFLIDSIEINAKFKLNQRRVILPHRSHPKRTAAQFK